MKLRARTAAALWAITASACAIWLAPASAAASIHGAGATFPARLYAVWASAYAAESGIQVSYEAVGSGAGLDRIRKRQVDFGASDAPLTPQELDASGLVQFPVVLGGVVPVIGMAGIRPGQLKLTGGLLAEIYLGKIRRWNEASIAALNPDIVLPNANITVVHRSDPSGSSLLWADYLSRSSASWRTEAGASLTPRWPRGVGATGSEGVAAFVERTRFSIGYVEYSYARIHRLSDVALRNRDGRFVQAGRDAFRAAAESARWGADESSRQLPTDAPGPQSWPITGASYILLARRPDSGDKTRAVLRFFDWALHHSESLARGTDFVPIPQDVLEQLPAVWRTIQDAAGEPVWP